MIANLADCTVIVVTYNSAHCLPSLAAALQSVPNVTMVDNGSADATLDQAAALLPHARLLANGRNFGFGTANNRGLADVTTPYALLLNPDCVVTPEDIARLVQVARIYPDAAIFAPQLTRRDHSLEVSYRWPDNLWRSRGPEASGHCCVGFATGAALLLNMAIMRQQVGFFDESFFLYYEDEDLCQRVFDCRLEIIVVPEVRLTHLSRGSVKGRNPLRAEFIRGYHHAQSKLLFEHKHVNVASASRLRWKTLGLALLTLVPRLLLPQPKYLARLAGRIAGLCRGYPQPRS